MYAKMTQGILVMMNLMCQLAWITGCPGIWSNVILGVSGMVFLMILTFESVD